MTKKIKEKSIEISTEAKVIQPSQSQFTETITLDPNYLNQAKSWEDFVSLWTISKEIDIRNQWFKGDIVERIVAIYGENSLKKFAEEIKESVVTLENYRRVSRAFPIGKRYWNLSWTHYFIASFTDSYRKSKKKFLGIERYKWIEKAHDEGWNVTRLTEEIKKSKALVGKSDILYDYYSEYLKKTRNILLHIEKEKLTKEEKGKLVEQLIDICEEFKTYLEIAT